MAPLRVESIQANGLGLRPLRDVYSEAKNFLDANLSWLTFATEHYRMSIQTVD